MARPEEARMEEQTRYAVGDLVVPVDLPRTFVCSVARTIGAGGEQLLELTPLAGPWPAGTRLVRLYEMVRRAHPTEIAPNQRTARRRDRSRGAARQPILTVVGPPDPRPHTSPAVRRRPEYPGR
jgi:hypothetical protein